MALRTQTQQIRYAVNKILGHDNFGVTFWSSTEIFNVKIFISTEMSLNEINSIYLWFDTNCCFTHFKILAKIVNNKAYTILEFIR